MSLPARVRAAYNAFRSQEKRSIDPKSRYFVVPLARGFQAAENDRLTAGWGTTTTPINLLLETHLKALRARSRDQAVNNSLAARYFKLLQANVVGPDGIRLQANVIGRDGRDREVNQAIENAWKEWGKKGNCDVTGSLSWLDVQNLLLTTAARDGEAIARIVTSSRYPFGFALQVLDPERLPVDYRHDLGEGKRIRLGIEFDSWGRPLAYHIEKELLEFVGGYYSRSQRYERIPASEIIHVFFPERPEQLRGYPWLTPTLWDMKMLHGYIQSAAVAARVGAAKVGVITTDGDLKYRGEGEAQADGSGVVEADPGTFFELKTGQSFSGWDPTYPNGEFGDFRKALVQQISSGANIAYEPLANDRADVNYSSMRAGVLEDREAWKGLQRWYIASLHEYVYRAFIPNAILLQKIILPASGVPVRDRALTTNPTLFAPRWQPRRWSWVDPQKDASANNDEIDAKTRSRFSVMRDRGENPEDVLDEIAEENEAYRERGIRIPSGNGSGVAGNETEVGSGVADNETGDPVAETEPEPLDGPDSGSLDEERSVSVPTPLFVRKIRMNERAKLFALAQIRQGLFDLSEEWKFGPKDQAALMKTRAGRFFLEESPERGNNGYTHPTGKFVGSDFVVHYGALEQAKTNTDDEAIVTAANQIIAAMETGGLLMGTGTILGGVADVGSGAEEDEPKPPEEPPNVEDISGGPPSLGG